jgi:hypothetical protein
MTSYHVIAPVFIGRFQEACGVIFRAWSPRRYGPVYTYDIIIEAEDDQHPSMNIEYIEALQRVMDGTDIDVVDAVDATSAFVDLTTDYHCPTVIEDRGDTLFLITLRDSPFSPVFFLKQDAEIYLEHLYASFPTCRHLLALRTADHSFV